MNNYDQNTPEEEKNKGMHGDRIHEDSGDNQPHVLEDETTKEQYSPGLYEPVKPPVSHTANQDQTEQEQILSDSWLDDES